MATGSTASSGTDPHDAEARQEAEGSGGSSGVSGGAAHDPTRRAFFFHFGKQAASAVGQLAGMADVVGRTSSALAGELLGLDPPESEQQRSPFVRSGATTDPVVSAAQPAAENAYRSAYRLADDGIVLLDQRHLPEALEEVVARRGSDVAYYLRLGVARGGPLMAQVAAYGLWLTAAERAGRPAEHRRVEFERTARALIDARPSSRALAAAVARMQAVATGLGDEADGLEVAGALRAEADTIAGEATASEAALAVRLGSDLVAAHDSPLTLLVHGGQGSLVAGQLGAGVAALTRIRDGGRDVRIFVAEGRPFMDGARLASWELRQAGLAHRIVPDSAAAWLFAREHIDAVLMRAEWVAANGDVGALLGARALAQLAAVADERPRVVVIAPAAATDAGTADGAAIPSELRPARELAAYLSETPIRASDALVPASDVVPAALIDVLVTASEQAA